MPGGVAATPSGSDRVVSTGGYPLGNAINTADRRNGTPEARNSHKSRYICVTTAHQASRPGELQVSTSSYTCHVPSAGGTASPPPSAPGPKDMQN